LDTKLLDQELAKVRLYIGEREAFEDTLRRLAYERIIPEQAVDVFTPFSPRTISVTALQAHLQSEPLQAS
jgi:hypothetical protein